MTHPADELYPNPNALVHELFALDKLTAVEDRQMARRLYDLHQALEAKRQGKRVSRDGFTFDNETDGKQHAAGDR
ncbi:MAG TPA: hypothetical protein VHO25_16630 [Polyangiaceae bacterium]|nr:hypothetical protein [Polyangiaceae bacterium]